MSSSDTSDSSLGASSLAAGAADFTSTAEAAGAATAKALGSARKAFTCGGKPRYTSDMLLAPIKAEEHLLRPSETKHPCLSG